MKGSKITTYIADKEFFNKIRSQSKLAYVGQTRSEEIFNTLTHALASLLSVAGFIVLISFTASGGDLTRILTCGLYGISLIFLYVASMLYHGSSNYKRKKFFHMLDHSAIFILIAGTNTPILLTYLPEHWGWEIFWAAWVLAATGVFLEIFMAGKIPKYISISLYSLMGWMILLAAKPMFEILPGGLLNWLFLGGITYMIGIIFYVRKTLFFNHVIWHLVVMLGSAFHYIGILSYVAMKVD
ncbi:MAG: hemolysin III family protein [Spirochaetia bacterium]|nr:hemolysin III family protein [Spirochaetia bacterium]